MPNSKDRQCKGVGCSRLIQSRGVSGYCAGCLNTLRAQNAGGNDRAGQVATIVSPKEALTLDREQRAQRAANTDLRHKYESALETIGRLEGELRTVNALGTGRETFEIAPKVGHRTSEGTAVAVMSDWHVEETVDPAVVSGLNDFSLNVAKGRIERLFQGTLRLVNLLHQDINITTVVLALLGDFITNNIHEELHDVTSALPMHALVVAQNHIISGIEFLLANLPDTQFVVVCHSGNHARTTKKTHFSAENGHSLEYLMYLHLAAYFRAESRMTFIIPEGYHSYMNVYGKTLRFHHGHSIKYQGGVGGVYIPTNKAIAQWNKARKADYDVFGHYHQLVFGNNFVLNGSLIGYNAFALSIKADYEVPQQGLFLMDKKRGMTARWPILLEEPK